MSKKNRKRNAYKTKSTLDRVMTFIYAERICRRIGLYELSELTEIKVSRLKAFERLRKYPNLDEIISICGNLDLKLAIREKKKENN